MTGNNLNVSALVMTVAVDGRRVGLTARLEDGGEVNLWLSAAQFEAMLLMHQRAARDLGIAWPKALPTN